MSTLQFSPPRSNSLEPPRPAFMTIAGQVYRAATQGGVQRCTPLALALMSSAAPIVCWRIETHRQEG